MDYEEEQKNELEALSEIYYNEIKVISDQAPITFSIKIRPQASNYVEPEVKGDSEDEDEDEDDEYDDDEDDDGQEDVIPTQRELFVELKFEFPPKYPDEKPSIQILESQDLLEDELEELMNNLTSRADELLGTVMVFMLVGDVVEWLMTKTEREALEIEQERDRRQREVEAEETKKIIGTPVTVQSFLAWKAKFDAEMLKLALDQQKQQVSDQGSSAATKRLTGRAMFESDRTLAESDLDFVEDLDQNQIEALLHNIEEVDIDDDDEYELELSGSEDGDDDDDTDFDEEDTDEEDESQKTDSKVSAKVSEKKKR